MNVYFLNFNNYINRIVKKFDSISDYIPYAITIDTYSETGYVNYNFNPNDGIYTSMIVGSGEWIKTPDYCIVQDPETGDIVSRWFIMEFVRTRGGQYEARLYRDTVADFYNDIVDAPCFIEKATLNSDNPLIFNSENMTFNQIKMSETLLKDKSDCAWIVGYYSKNTPSNYLTGAIYRNVPDDNYDILINQSFESWDYNAVENPFYLKPINISYRVYGDKGARGPLGGQPKPGYFLINPEKDYASFEITGVTLNYYSVDFDGQYNTLRNSLPPLFKNNQAKLESYLSGYTDLTTESESSYFLNLQGKVIKDSLGKYYSILITQEEIVEEVVDILAGNLFVELSNILKQESLIKGTPNVETFKVVVQKAKYKMTATELKQLSSVWDLSQSKIVTEDAPYNIFAMPLGEITLKNAANEIVCVSNQDASISAANSIINTMQPSAGGGYLYDIQLLPYCPLFLENEKEIIAKSDLAYGTIKDGEDNIFGFILNIPKSRFSKNIFLKNPIIITDTKVQSECDFYKLCSPNWASEFSFNAAKNGGVEYFNIDCEYKPYTPYIHVNPNFGMLYGRDFDDARGLILSGDFSLSQITQAWETYQIQNKNFQNIFDRQIQNMEVSQKVERIQDVVEGIAGTVQGGAKGAQSGAQYGGGYGAVIGAVVGTAASGAGAIADYNLKESLRNEAIDFTKDNFGYQLGNIKALPYTLSKVSSFNNNNKIYPVLEYYTCTDVEKEALKNKIKYNGMTVMAIGRLAEYAPTITNLGEQYVKGKIIRMPETLQEDHHLANQIVSEIYKGVYI